MHAYSWHLFPCVRILRTAITPTVIPAVPYDRNRAKELYENYFEQVEFTDQGAGDACLDGRGRVRWRPDANDCIFLNGIFVGEGADEARKSINEHIKYLGVPLGGVH